jgi:hypothetical protein
MAAIARRFAALQMILQRRRCGAAELEEVASLDKNVLQKYLTFLKG